MNTYVNLNQNSNNNELFENIQNEYFLNNHSGKNGIEIFVCENGFGMGSSGRP